MCKESAIHNKKPVTLDKKSKNIVIGENQYGRVDVFAKDHGYETISDWLYRTGKTWAAEVNKEFINEMIGEGRQFIDIGPDFSRSLMNRMNPNTGRPPSDIYGSERQQLIKYNNHIKLYKRSGTLQGGVKGLDN